MSQDLVAFHVTALAARVPEGVPLEWEGRELRSGPLTIELEPSPEGGSSRGVLDYGRRYAGATFHVRLAFPELAGMLEGTGVAPELTRPVRAVLRSEGEILEDHSFALSGACRLEPHELLADARTAASVLPGH
jgi:hypothetical protein